MSGRKHDFIIKSLNTNQLQDKLNYIQSINKNEIGPFKAPVKSKSVLRNCRIIDTSTPIFNNIDVYQVESLIGKSRANRRLT